MNAYSILIVDDDESTHDVLGQYLELAGFKVLHARDGAAGIVTAEQMKPDLVLLDVNMPVMDGFRTMEVISATRELRNIPVLFLTSLDRANLKIKGLELGAEDYILKPYNKAELLARVKAALRRTERYRRAENTLEGNLSDMALSELLQSLDISRKSAVIELKEIGASIGAADGKIESASFREFGGHDAFVRILALEKGRFSIRFGPLDEKSGRLGLHIQRTLFEAVTYVDELKSLLSGDLREDLLLDFGSSGIEALSGLAVLSPMKFFDLLCSMSGDLKENAGILKKAYEEGRISAAS